MNREAGIPEASCRLRAIRDPDGRVRVIARNVSLAVAGSLGLDEKSPDPSALDLLVGSLAADLLTMLGREAARGGVALHDAELRLDARLENPLVALGVVGERGHPGVAAIAGTLSARTATGAEDVHSLWERARARSPVHATLSRSVPIHIDLRLFA
jgi:hypothetical protein